MRCALLFAIAAIFASQAASADDRLVITHAMQEMSDALAVGNTVIWNRYLDPDAIFVEEDDTYKGKPGMLREMRPLPPGLSGEIKVDLLEYREDGEVAVALFRQNEVEGYYAQTLHAKYLMNTTWRKRADGWKLIAAQALAEKTDPPAIQLPAKQLAQYAGTYRLKGADQMYDVTLANGQLTATRRGRKSVVWNAEASDVFFAKGDPRIRNIFQRNASGRVTGFVERRESWDIVWEKVN